MSPRIAHRLLSALLCTAALALALSCAKDPLPVISGGEDSQDRYSSADKDTGLDYIYGGSIIPEIHITVPLDQWNALLAAYDQDHNTKEQVSCDVMYRKGSDVTTVTQAGLRLRGNTSRRRPEGSDGKMHSSSGTTDWHHCHFQVNFRKYVKDDAHTVHGARKIILKWCKDDPSYVRELYCYDLFRRAGVWSASRAAYCKLYIRVEGDAREAYFGIYCMIEPVDDEFLKARRGEFGSSEGFLWKCRYGASLASTSVSFGPDLDDGKEYVYELKTGTDNYAAAEAQLKGFISKVKGTRGDDFSSWISQVCDVDHLLRTYAVNVATGMWDDYWNNKNNFYIYFSSRNRYNYKFWFIPFDYDNTLGTSSNCVKISDSGRQDPFNWGDSSSNPLIAKLLDNDSWRESYRRSLLELVDPAAGLLDCDASVSRIQKWQNSISGMTANDTGEDEMVRDRPASWSNHSEYRLTDTGSNNFFKVKAETINKYCNQ